MSTEATIHHPPYLDDEGGGTRCFLLHHLAASRGEAEKIVEHLGFDWDWRAAESDVVWLAPVEGGGQSGEDYYEPTEAHAPGAVRYWRWRW
jgi:hypothetical protein